MDVVYELGEATVADVEARLPEAPSYSTVRTLMKILEEKGSLKHRQVERAYVYSPTEPAAKASRKALKQVVRTFFEGSLAKAVAAFVDAKDGQLDADELARLEEIVREAKKRKGKEER